MAKGRLIGEVLGGCRIESKLGQGGMGSVYKAHHEALDIPVALKILSPLFASQSPTAVDRFVQEARVAARLKHPNIVGVMNVGKERGAHFIVMQFVEGQTLEERLEGNKRLSFAQALPIMQQVCEALEYARENNMVHRDIKPDNIMIETNGTVRLTDLGLAKNTEEDHGLTATGIAMGTPHYMAPEQAEDTSCATHLSDIYSLGCTFFRMLSGDVPYKGATMFKVIDQHRTAPVPDSKEFAPDIPRAAVKLVRKMMAKAPEDRYPSARAVLDDLNAIPVSKSEMPTVRAGARRPKQKKPASGKRRASPQPRNGAKRKWLFAAAGAGLLVLILLGLGVRSLVRKKRHRNRVAAAATQAKEALEKKDYKTAQSSLEDALAAVPENTPGRADLIPLLETVREEAGKAALAEKIAAAAASAREAMEKKDYKAAQAILEKALGAVPEGTPDRADLVSLLETVKKNAVKPALETRIVGLVDCLKRTQIDQAVEFVAPKYRMKHGDMATKIGLGLFKGMLDLAGVTSKDIRVADVAFEREGTVADVTPELRIKGRWEKKPSMRWVLVGETWYMAPEKGKGGPKRPKRPGRPPFSRQP